MYITLDVQLFFSAFRIQTLSTLIGTKNMFPLICFLSFLHVAVVRAAPIERIMVDLTYTYNEHVPNFPLWKKFNMTVVINGSDTFGTWIQGEEMITATHMGTHMDAPSHFTLGGINIDEVSLSDFIAPAAVINIAERAAADPDAEVTVDDLVAWEASTGQTLDGTVVLMNSGWGAKWLNKADFTGTAEEDASKLRFPGFSGEAAQWLVDNRNIKGIGSDTLSFDRGSSRDYASHKIILNKGLYGLENVANLDKIPIYGATLYVFPMKIGRASGAPTRVIATYPKVVFNRVNSAVIDNVSDTFL